MKIEIFDETPPSSETVIRLRLVEWCGEVALVVVDERGQRVTNGTILTVKYGGVHLHGGLCESIPLPRGSFGRVKIVEE